MHPGKADGEAWGKEEPAEIPQWPCLSRPQIPEAQGPSSTSQSLFMVSEHWSATVWPLATKTLNWKTHPSATLSLGALKPFVPLSFRMPYCPLSLGFSHLQMAFL